MNSAIFHLSDSTNWNPSFLVGSKLSNIWPQSIPLEKLSNLAQIVEERHVLDAGSRVVERSRVSEFQEISFTYSKIEQNGVDFTKTSGLSEGDLILYPGKPVLHLDSSHKKLAFVGSFLALRPVSREAGFWLWGVLNSRDGAALLEINSRKSGALSPRYTSDFLGQLVPKMQVQDKYVFDKLADVKMTRVPSPITFQAPSQNESWSKIVFLESLDSWKKLFASPSDTLAFAGTPFSEMYKSVSVGKTQAVIEGHGQRIPLATHRTVMHGEFGEIIPTATTVIADPGTLLIPVTGEKIGAHILTKRAAIGKGIYAIELLPDVSMQSVYAFFLSDTCFLQRKSLLTGIAIKQLSKSALDEFQIPDSPMEKSIVKLSSVDFDWILQ